MFIFRRRLKNVIIIVQSHSIKENGKCHSQPAPMYREVSCSPNFVFFLERCYAVTLSWDAFARLKGFYIVCIVRIFCFLTLKSKCQIVLKILFGENLLGWNRVRVDKNIFDFVKKCYMKFDKSLRSRFAWGKLPPQKFQKLSRDLIYKIKFLFWGLLAFVFVKIRNN